MKLFFLGSRSIDNIVMNVFDPIYASISITMMDLHYFMTSTALNVTQ